MYCWLALSTLKRLSQRSQEEPVESFCLPSLPAKVRRPTFLLDKFSRTRRFTPVEWCRLRVILGLSSVVKLEFVVFAFLRRAGSSCYGSEFRFWCLSQAGLKSWRIFGQLPRRPLEDLLSAHAVEASADRSTSHQLVDRKRRNSMVTVLPLERRCCCCCSVWCCGFRQLPRESPSWLSQRSSPTPPRSCQEHIRYVFHAETDGRKLRHK